jgi:hypothetical protein
MIAIVYFGEMLVASLLAIVLLAISQLRMGSDAVLFAGGVVALALAQYLVHRFVLHGFAPIEHRLHHANPDGAVLTIFLRGAGLGPRPQTRRLNPAGFSFPFVGRGKLLIRPLKPMLTGCWR